jgi:hypothetical protein
MAEDERRPRERQQRRNEMPDGRRSLLLCRDCKAYTLYGPEVCSYCLSERLEWLSPDQEEDTQPMGPR